MEITHSKGLMYPALQMSSFRVRRDSLPPAFEMPEEVARATQEPLPDVPMTSLEEDSLERTLKLLKEDDRERAMAQTAIAKEEAERERLAREEKEKAEATPQVSESATANAADAANEAVVRRVCDMGFPADKARAALGSHNWDETAAVNALLNGC